MLNATVRPQGVTVASSRGGAGMTGGRTRKARRSHIPRPHWMSNARGPLLQIRLSEAALVDRASPRPGPKPPSVLAGGRIELTESCATQRREFHPPEHRVADKHGEGPHVLRGPSRRAGTRWSFPLADVARTGTGRYWSTQPTVRCVLQASVALRLPGRCGDGCRIPMLTV